MKMKKIFKYIIEMFGISLVLLAVTEKWKYLFTYAGVEKNPMEGKKVIFVEDENDKENADGVRGHLEAVGESCYHAGFYEKYIKRAIDIVLSFGGLIVLSPVFLIIAFAIVIENPGPVFFTQKRLGQNKQYFKLHKFRSMKVSTPHDIPTHMLENPEQYITKVGKFLRAHSLDELPQIWDIFVGNLSTIGPRPGLWNQDLLTAERDKYGANDVKPGLTGWAQINGRDELEIPVKAKLDGEYVEKMSFLFDMKCFLRTVSKVARDESVIEGGPGEIKKIGRCYTEGKSREELIGNIGFGEPVKVDHSTRRKILITGVGSYIGESFQAYAEEYYPENFVFNTLDMREPAWKNYDFSKYDIVYHVAGIAHADVGKVSEKIKEKYYVVNTDLAVEVVEKAKSEGVREFIFMSSMIVYGDSAPYGKEKIIDENTVPEPANFYGDSKLQADVAVRDLADDNFKVIVLRPPMIYGRGSKGNYPVLAKLARKLPVFPDVDNKRSMLYIENLCEFLCQIMLVEVKQNASVFIPQNAEWSTTSQMVKEIAEVNGKSILVLGGIMKIIIWLGGKLPGKAGALANKAFGNNCYAHTISEYSGIDYQKNSLEDSIEKTEALSPQHTSLNNVCIINCFDTYEHRVDLLHNYFKSIGSNVRVITSDFRHFEKCKRNDKKEDFEYVTTHPYYKNLSIERLLSHFILSRRIFRRIKGENFDLIWVLIPPNSFVKGAVHYKKVHKDTKLVLDLIDLWPETMPISKFKFSPLFSWWTRLRDKYLDLADEIVTECNFYQKKLPKSINKSKIHTLYLAREVKEFKQQLHLPEDKISLCYLGSINNIIDIPVICRIIRGIGQYKGVVLHIVGDGERREELISTSRAAGAEVIYHGKIYNPSEKRAVFDSCHYGLNIMKDSVFVGLTMKSIDYFEAGLPIINNIKGDTWEFIEENRLGYNIKSNMSYRCFDTYDKISRRKVREFYEIYFGIERFNSQVSNIIFKKNVNSCINTRVIAGIVTYNPNIKRLMRNINAIYEQVEEIVIFDNGSENADSILELKRDRIKIICNNENKGIAYALNIIMQYAKKSAIDWVITLDQDSICPDNYINKAKILLHNPKIGQIVPVLFESNSGIYHYLGNQINGKEYQVVKKSITSASITNVNVWEQISGFDEDLFIDYVDYDYAMRLQKAGFQIVRINSIKLDHQIGNSVNRRIGVFHIRVSNHSAFRKYYIARNMVIFVKRYCKGVILIEELMRLIKVIIIAIVFEDDKINKIIAIKRGIIDGIRF